MKLEHIEVSGSPRAMGRAQGEAFREKIGAFIEMRLDAVRGYLGQRGYTGKWERILEVGKESFGLFEAWDPAGHSELVGIAEGAGVDPERLFTTTNMTDMRDAVLLAAASGPPLSPVPDEGCSSLMVPAGHTAAGRPLVGQTWDLNPPDVEYIVAIHRKPDEGPEAWSVTCTGCLSLMGVNADGVAMGTTNIKTYGSKPGVGYLSILHRILRSRSIEEATDVVTNAPHAGAHTYWIADPQHQVEFEASPNNVLARPVAVSPVWRTNHCLAPPHQELEGEVVGESSVARFERLGELLGEGGHTLETLKVLFSDRSKGVLSINRYAEDGQGTATNAVFIASPVDRKAWACRGPADRGEWIELGF